MGDTRRVDLVSGARDGLRLCPCDITPGNFKKCTDGTVVALDFCATCFLPPSFFAVAMAKIEGTVGQTEGGQARQLSAIEPCGGDGGCVLFLGSVREKRNRSVSLTAFHFFLVNWPHDWTGIPRDFRQRKGL